MMQPPRFSIVIPCYNSEATLRRAVDSCLAQTWSDFELVLVDDCSSDGTPALLVELAAELAAEPVSELMPVRVLRHFRLARNSGPSQARNHGWNEARGDYIAFLDADDVWATNKLAIIDAALRAGGDALFLLGHAHGVLTSVSEVAGTALPDSALAGSALPGSAAAADTTVLPDALQPVSWTTLLLRNIAQTSCITVRRELSLRFDTRMRYAEDHDLWLRIRESGPVAMLPAQVLTWLSRPQMASGGLSGNRWQMRKGELRMYSKLAQRHYRWLLLLPLLWAFSLLKHLWAMTKACAS